jgi:hypothetical protein
VKEVKRREALQKLSSFLFDVHFEAFEAEIVDGGWLLD